MSEELKLTLPQLEEKLKTQQENIEKAVKDLIAKESNAPEITKLIDKLKEQSDTNAEAIEKIQENIKEKAKAHIPGLKDELKKKEFDFGSFIYSAYNQCRGTSEEKAWAGAEYEKEILDTYAKTKGQIAGDGTSGGYLFPDDVSSIIVGLTIPNLAMSKMGATTMTGLVGELPIPRQTARNTGYNVGETEAPTLSNITFDQFTLRPKKIGALSWYSNRLKYQTRGLINNIIKESISETLAIKADLDFLRGTGSDSQALGILNQTGFTTTPNQSTNAVRFRIDKAAAMVQAIDTADELVDNGNFGFIFRPEVMGGMRRERVPQFTGQPIGQGQPLALGEVIMSKQRLETELGYKFETTTQLLNTQTRGTSSTSSTVIFGNWKQFFMGFWRDFEIKVSDRATVGGVDAFSRDLIFVVAFQEIDCNVGRPTAFTTVLDAETNEANWTNG